MEKQSETEKLLKLNLQHFADGGTGSEGGDGSGAENTDKSADKDSDKGSDDKGTDKGSDKGEEHMIPKSRFDEVNTNFKDMKDKVEKMEAEIERKNNEQAEKEDADAEKRGEFEDLYGKEKEKVKTTAADLKSSKERVEALEGVITSLLETKLEGIDEDYHDLIPEGMTPEQKLEWVNTAESKGIFKTEEKEDKAKQPVGGASNPSDKQQASGGVMDAMAKMASGYGTK